MVKNGTPTSSTANCVVAKGTKIEGKLFAQDAVVMGTVRGDINVTETLHLQATAKIQGNIITKYLMVDEGAIFNGDCKVSG